MKAKKNKSEKHFSHIAKKIFNLKYYLTIKVSGVKKVLVLNKNVLLLSLLPVAANGRNHAHYCV